MDRINFLAEDNFPLSSNTLQIMQNLNGLSAKTAYLGGFGNYILAGCEENAGNVSEGIIVISGELFQFEGGAKQTYVKITEFPHALSAFGVDYPEAVVSRKVSFSATGTDDMRWAGFARVLTNEQLQQKVESIKGDPAGTIKMWPKPVAPEGYKLCDGSPVSNEDFPELFELIGTQFGGDGNPYFALPNLKERFVVGYNLDKPDYSPIGKTGGEEKHTLTLSEMPEHSHAYTDDTNAAGKFPEVASGFPQVRTGFSPSKSSAEDAGWGTVYDTEKKGGNASHENRPPYLVLAYIIKVK
jgi:microcystin-dependent protein